MYTVMLEDPGIPFTMFSQYTVAFAVFVLPDSIQLGIKDPFG
jgi:hypothetical protein